MATQSVDNTTAKNVAIARAAYEAYVTKDRAALDRLRGQPFIYATAWSSCDRGEVLTVRPVTGGSWTEPSRTSLWTTPAIAAPNRRRQRD